MAEEPHGFTEDGARRIVRQVRTDEGERPPSGRGPGPPPNRGQLTVMHVLPGEYGVQEANVASEQTEEEYTWSALATGCPEDEVLEVRTAPITYEFNRRGFFEGQLFQDELFLGINFGDPNGTSTWYAVGGRHLSVTGEKVTVTENGADVEKIRMTDCGDIEVPFEWLVTPAEDVEDGTVLLAVWVRSKNAYVVGAYDCEGNG